MILCVVCLVLSVAGGSVGNLVVQSSMKNKATPVVAQKGEKGDAGLQGEKGEKGDAGLQGEKGDGFKIFHAANATDYQVGECIIYNGFTYVVIEKPSDGTPPDSSNNYLSFSAFYQMLKAVENEAAIAQQEATRANQRLDNQAY